jgi:bacterioferritin-associated ferredoxin
MIWIRQTIGMRPSREMYVCLCHGVTDSAIREAVHDGVQTFRELSFKTGCGTRCGRCVGFARSLLRDNLWEVAPRARPPQLRVVSAA